MSTSDRFQQYTMKIIESEIVFYRKGDEADKGAIRQELSKVRVHSLDSPVKKVMKTHFCLWLSSLNGHRKIYFAEFEELQNAARYILESQGFSSRAAQYKHKQDLPDNSISERSIVKHRKTMESFVMKRIEKNSPLISLVMSEFNALQTLSKYKSKFCDLVDFFEDDESTYLVEKHSKQTLLEHVRG